MKPLAKFTQTTKWLSVLFSYVQANPEITWYYFKKTKVIVSFHKESSNWTGTGIAAKFKTASSLSKLIKEN